MRAWLARGEATLAPFYLLSDPALIEARARRLALPVDIAVVEHARDCAAAFDGALPVLPLAARFSDRPGVPDTGNAPGILESIERAVADVTAGDAAAVVTCPIAKKTLYDAGFAHPGHTEFLAALASSSTGEPPRPVMMLAGPELRAVPVTIHIPLAAVAGTLSTALIVETGQIVARDLRQRFGIPSPRLAIAGLNPHAGEGGALGLEDDAIVRPAVEALRSQGIDARGPLPADTMFHKAARAGYDAALCMYHDQALIPAKALAFDESVNVTLGLPFVRTSPDHGTAFDIAERGIARADSLIAAIRLARALADGTTASS